MNQQADIQRTAKLRNGMGACSLLALRAVAQSAIPVQQACRAERSRACAVIDATARSCLQEQLLQWRPFSREGWAKIGQYRTQPVLPPRASTTAKGANAPFSGCCVARKKQVNFSQWFSNVARYGWQSDG